MKRRGAKRLLVHSRLSFYIATFASMWLIFVLAVAAHVRALTTAVVIIVGAGLMFWGVALFRNAPTVAEDQSRLLMWMSLRRRRMPSWLARVTGATSVLIGILWFAGGLGRASEGGPGPACLHFR
ncbi:MAG: hypothetical protein ACHQTF_11085 [Gemmatimonadales bacterium]